MLAAAELAPLQEGGLLMVKEQLRDESINAKEMKRQLTRILRRMHKMKIPDAEIMNVIYNIMDAMQNQRSSFRQCKDAFFRMLFSNNPALLSLYNALNNSDSLYFIMVHRT